MHSQTAQPSYSVNFAELDKVLERMGHTSDSDKARFLGVNRSTYQRQRRQEHQPSLRLMSAIQSQFPALVELVSHPTGPAGPRPSGPAGPRPKVTDEQPRPGTPPRRPKGPPKPPAPESEVA